MQKNPQKSQFMTGVIRKCDLIVRRLWKKKKKEIQIFIQIFSATWYFSKWFESLNNINSNKASLGHTRAATSQSPSQLFKICFDQQEKKKYFSN